MHAHMLQAEAVHVVEEVDGTQAGKEAKRSSKKSESGLAASVLEEGGTGTPPHVFRSFPKCEAMLL